ncbi:MAG: hypothetical protein D4R67_06170 [Bacteroidetes bacterium]|nr:MAG: hypothetical protein D4R67_06170 [Bacteroidota bacterium]
MIFALTLSGIFILPPKASSQDTLKEKPGKMISVKIDMDENGESFAIDTTFVIDENFDMEAFEEAMEQYQGQMKDFEKLMQEMQINLSEKEMQQVQEKVGRSLRDAYRVMPRERGQWRWACQPEHLEHFCLPEHMQFIPEPPECRGMVRFRSGNKGETLSDVLGDIPMRAVKSYKVKEIKNGKRITIEVSDDALLGPPDRDVLIWHREMPEEVEEPAKTEEPK